MDHDGYSDDYIADILGSVRVFAFVGASANTSRPSYFAMKYLLGKGYTVHPVNPGYAGRAILGQPVYATLADVPAPVLQGDGGVHRPRADEPAVQRHPVGPVCGRAIAVEQVGERGMRLRHRDLRTEIDGR